MSVLKSEIAAIVESSYLLILKESSQYAHLEVALRSERTRRAVVAVEIQALCEDLQNTICVSEKNLETVKALSLQRMEDDYGILRDVWNLEKSLKEHQALARDKNPLKTSRMLKILGVNAKEGAYPFLKNHFEALIDSLINGTTMQDYDYSYYPNRFTQLDCPARPFYGSAKGSFYKTALCQVHLIYQNLWKLSDIMRADHMSASTHSDMLSPILFEQLPSLEQCTYFSSRDDAMNQIPLLNYIHSGYSLRPDFNLKRNPWSPQDCSSWAGMLIAGVPFNTAELFMHYKLTQKHLMANVSNRFYSSYLESADVTLEVLFSHLTPVEIRDPQTDIKPGMLWCKRTFEKNKICLEGFKYESTMPPTLIGKSGHCALVMSSGDTSGSFYTLGYARCIPEKEGYGFEKIHSQRETSFDSHFFFKVNKPRNMALAPNRVSEWRHINKI